MFCAFAGGPRILRPHGQAEFVTPESAGWGEICDRFPVSPGVRSIILANISRVCTSCGFSVPEYDFVQQRKVLTDWAEKTGAKGVIEYQEQRNRQSIDGLPALD